MLCFCRQPLAFSASQFFVSLCAPLRTWRDDSPVPYCAGIFGIVVLIGYSVYWSLGVASTLFMDRIYPLPSLSRLAASEGIGVVIHLLDR